RAGRRDSEVLDVDCSTCPAASDRRHDQAAVRSAREAAVQRQRLVGKIAIGLQAAADSVALERRIEDKRQLARGKAAATEAGEIGSEMQIAARGLQHDLGLGGCRSADVVLQETEARQGQRQVDLTGALTAAAGRLESDGFAGGARGLDAPGPVALQNRAA